MVCCLDRVLGEDVEQQSLIRREEQELEFVHIVDDIEQTEEVELGCCLLFRRIDDTSELRCAGEKERHEAMQQDRAGTHLVGAKVLAALFQQLSFEVSFGRSYQIAFVAREIICLFIYWCFLHWCLGLISLVYNVPIA